VGNIASVQAALAQLGVVRDGTYFATPAETERRLAASGFVDARAWLQPEPTPFDSAEALGTYLATIVIRAPLAALPETERPAFVRAVVKRLPRLQIDYVRLNVRCSPGRSGGRRSWRQAGQRRFRPAGTGSPAGYPRRRRRARAVVEAAPSKRLLANSATGWLGTLSGPAADRWRDSPFHCSPGAVEPTRLP
jgi:hypothetical protein